MTSGDDGYPRPEDGAPPPRQPTEPPTVPGVPAPPHGEPSQPPAGQPYGQAPYGPPAPGHQPPQGQPQFGPRHGQQQYGRFGQVPYGPPDQQGPYGQQGGPWPGGGWQGAPSPPSPGPWQMPTQPSASRRRGWVLPVVAVGAVLAVAGGTFTVMQLRDSGPGAVPDGKAAASASPVASASSAPEANVCAMLDPDETERLVPDADIRPSTWDNRDNKIVSYITWNCTWSNRDISFKDKRRMRQIEVRVSRYEAVGTTTAERAARVRFDSELKGYEYSATASKKEHYYSKPKVFSDIGEQAAARYQWRRGDLRYAFGEGIGRIGDVVFEVKYEAKQQDKEAGFLSTDTIKSITEENALREVEGLLRQLAKSITAWRSGQAMPYTPRPKPSPTPSPTPTLIALPRPCVSVKPLAETLVPKTEGVAARSENDGVTVTECQWWNDKLPIGQGKVRWRNLRIAIRTFRDAESARYYLVDQRAGKKAMAGGGIGGIDWGRVQKLAGFGDDAFGQVIRQRTETARSNRYEIYALDGKNVVWVLFAGSDRPADTPINAPDSLLMSTKEAVAGAKSVAKAVLAAL